MHRSISLSIAFIIVIAWMASTTAAISSEVKKSENETTFRAQVIIRFIHWSPRAVESTLTHAFDEIADEYLNPRDGALGLIVRRSNPTQVIEMWLRKRRYVNRILRLLFGSKYAGEPLTTAMLQEKKVTEPPLDSMVQVKMLVGMAVLKSDSWSNVSVYSQAYLREYNLSVVAIVNSYNRDQTRAFIDSIYDKNRTTEIPLKMENYAVFSRRLVKEIARKVRMILEQCKWEMVPEDAPCRYMKCPSCSTCEKKECGKNWFNRKVTATEHKYKQFCQHNMTWFRCGHDNQCDDTCKNGPRQVVTPCNATCSDRDGMEEISIDQKYDCCDNIVPNEWRKCNLTDDEIAACGEDRPDRPEVKDGTRTDTVVIIVTVSLIVLILLVSLGAVGFLTLRRNRQRALIDSLGQREKRSKRKARKTASETTKSMTKSLGGPADAKSKKSNRKLPAASGASYCLKKSVIKSGAKAPTTTSIGPALSNQKKLG